MDTYSTLFDINAHLGGRRSQHQWIRINSKAKVMQCLIKKLFNPHSVSFFPRLMNWIKIKLPTDLPVRNFTTDWNDGKAIGALVDSVAPGLCPDWEVIPKFE